jgi:hypothetical protein
VDVSGALREALDFARDETWVGRVEHLRNARDEVFRLARQDVGAYPG